MNVESLTTGNIDHWASVQIIELIPVGHDEVACPKDIIFLIGKRNSNQTEWAFCSLWVSSFGPISSARQCENEKCNAEIRHVKSSLSGLRFHDLRHHAITELAESQTSDSTIMAIAGHVSSKMLQHYSHVRLQAKRDALD